MPDVLTRLRESDPAAHQDSAPPDELLRAILAAPPTARRQRPRRVLVALPLVAAAIAAVLVAPSSGPRVTLAQRAYAATAPERFVIYTEETTTQSGALPSSLTRMRMWQYGDRMHNFMDVQQRGRTWNYEHDQQGKVFRTLLDGKVDAIRSDDPGWKDGEGEQGFADNLRTVVDRFRAGIARATDLGVTTFNGKPAHAYRDGDETFYVDPETALPLGSTMTIGAGTITDVVDRYERLPDTPANLAELDAPNIDAAG